MSDECRIYKLKSYGTEYQIKLEETEYELGGYAVAMYCYDDGYWAPYDVLTTFLPGTDCKGTCAFVQKEKLDFVFENHLGKATGRVAESGYNQYIEIEFNI